MLRIILNNDVFVSYLFNVREQKKKKRNRVEATIWCISFQQSNIIKRVSSFFTCLVTSLFSIQTVCLHFRGLIFFPCVYVIKEVYSDE
jgi:hypothetical protein